MQLLQSQKVIGESYHFQETEALINYGGVYLCVCVCAGVGVCVRVPACGCVCACACVGVWMGVGGCMWVGGWVEWKYILAVKEGGENCTQALKIQIN